MATRPEWYKAFVKMHNLQPVIDEHVKTGNISPFIAAIDNIREGTYTTAKTEHNLQKGDRVIIKDGKCRHTVLSDLTYSEILRSAVYNVIDECVKIGGTATLGLCASIDADPIIHHGGAGTKIKKFGPVATNSNAVAAQWPSPYKEEIPQKLESMKFRAVTRNSLGFGAPDDIDTAEAKRISDITKAMCK